MNPGNTGNQPSKQFRKAFSFPALLFLRILQNILGFP
jgi:hypothetical protein